MNNILALPKTYGFGNFQITFYATFILVGALLALALSEWRVKQRGYNPHDIENLFLVAFPMGLVGARVWYCAWQFHEFNTGNFWTTILSFFGIYNGHFQGISGLAIQGGVLFGVTAGIIFLKKRRKNMKILDIVDSCVPTILVAQAIGRWGNFFNQEVYGNCVDAGPWRWLGQWFIDQMTVSSCSTDGSTIALPLFLIEGSLNILGFLIIVFVLDKALRKYMRPGVVAGAYFIWYGTVRMILEPLRNSQYIMSPDNSTFSTSKFIAILFIILGVLVIAGIYFNHYFLKKKNKDFTTLLLAYAPKFDSLTRKTRIILTAIPVTSWLNAIIYRFSKDNFTAALFAIPFGLLYWVMDLVYMIKDDKMGLWSDGQKFTKPVYEASSNKEDNKEEK